MLEQFIEMIQSCFENKAKTRIEKFLEPPSLHQAVIENNISEVMVCLSKLKVDINAQDHRYGATALHYAYDFKRYRKHENKSNKILNKQGNEKFDEDRSEIKKYLLKFKGIRTDIEDNNGITVDSLILQALQAQKENKIISDNVEQNYDETQILGEKDFSEPCHNHDSSL